MIRCVVDPQAGCNRHQIVKGMLRAAQDPAQVRVPSIPRASYCSVYRRWAPCRLWDDEMTNPQGWLRRLLVIPFDFRFKIPEEIDCNDSNHRLMNKTLADELLTPERQEQLLAWLVRGAVAWQRDGLPPAPAKVKAAFQECTDDNDDLQKFLDEKCEVGTGFEVQTVRFAEELNKRPENTGKYSQKKVNESMKRKGFFSEQSRNFPRRATAYQGVRIRPQELVVDFDDE